MSRLDPRQPRRRLLAEALLPQGRIDLVRHAFDVPAVAPRRAAAQLPRLEHGDACLGGELEQGLGGGRGGDAAADDDHVNLRRQGVLTVDQGREGRIVLPVRGRGVGPRQARGAPEPLEGALVLLVERGQHGPGGGDGARGVADEGHDGAHFRGRNCGISSYGSVYG